MKNLFLLIALLVITISASAQSIDERIGAFMNSSDYFGLYDTYHSVPKDSINPFLEVFSRCLIGNRFNRPDISIPAFDELLEKHSEYLDLNLLLSCSMMYSMDLSRVGRNKEASELLTSVLSAAYQTVDSISLTPYANMAAQYKALTNYSPYDISIDGENGAIPFEIIAVGKADSGQSLMRISDAMINENAAKITFDTGAGVNVISDSLANAYGLEFLDANVAATGVKTSAGRYAIAKKLKLGNITVKDVPFYVIDIRSHNEEADKYMDALEFIVGSELMLRLKDVTIDFSSKTIQVPKVAPMPSDARPDMCFSTGMNLLTAAEINGQPLLIKLDTGDASYGTLNNRFFERNKEYLTSSCQSDTIRQGGVGGVWSVLCYKLPNAALKIGGNTVTVPSIEVQTEQREGYYMNDNNLGLRSMMLYRKIRFNLVDMILTSVL